MLRKFACFAVTLLMVAGLHYSATAATSAEEAKAFTSKIGEKVLSVMNDDTQSNPQKLAQLEALFVDVVDVDWVGRFVLGRHWRSATEAQKTAYLPAYRDFLIKHYTSRFTEYSGETFTIEQAEMRREGEFRVRMNIQRPRGQEPVIVDYMLREKDDEFKVFDIVVEGVSLINTQRSEFTSAVERQGLDSLIDALQRKTASLAAQTSQDLDKKG